MLKGVEIVGMREFARKVRRAQPDLAVELRTGFRDIARVVADTARPTVPERSGRLRKSLRGRATAKSAEVAMGGAKAPYAGFIEFGNKTGAGGGVGRNDSVARPFVKEGRYLRPAYAKNKARVEIEARQVVERVAERLN